ncbi:MAG: Ada metal-binding domain-containing protein [Candidatus Nanopelagicales bacterium]
MIPDDDRCFQALVARDARFDGRFFVGVVTTGIYCRPVCPARTPHRRNVRFYPSAAAASAAGLRACRRCRPDSLPGSRAWDHRGDLVARALRLIGSGAADETGATGLAQQLHVTPRHLNRALVAEVGATAGALARARRAQTARLLLEQTGMSAADVAFASGFGSVRQFNDVMRRQFALTPGELRRAVPDDGRSAATTGVDVRLRFRPPYAAEEVLAWMSRHTVPGVDRVDVAERVVSSGMPDGTRVHVVFEERSVRARVELPANVDVRAIPTRIAAVRRWLDLDAAPARIDADLSRDPALGSAVRRVPGLRVLGALDPFRTLTSTIVSQQVSVAAAATQNGRLCEFTTGGDRFPTAAELAARDPDEVAGALGIPRRRGRALVEVAELVASAEVDLSAGADRDAVVDRLGQVAGIGPWTLADVRMRCLADPDVWPGSDLILRRAVSPGGRFVGFDPDSAAPWRSYAAHHVWVAHSVDQKPAPRVALSEENT